MAKKRSASMSKRIKTRHKKTNKNKKVTDQSHVNAAIRDINKVITQQVKSKPTSTNQHKQQGELIQVEAMTIDSFRKLTGNTQKKQKLGKLSIDDGMYLQKLIKKWGTNYARMAQDVKLNRMQWTAQQIQKKHQTYKKMFPQALQSQKQAEK